MLNTMRLHAEHINRNSGFPTFGLNALSCVNNFRVRSITLKLLDIFSWNMTQMLNTMTQLTEHMNGNSGFPAFGVIGLCVLTIFVSAS